MDNAKIFDTLERKIEGASKTFVLPPCNESAQRNCAPNSHPPVPDFECIHRSAVGTKVSIGRSDQVVEPSTDDASRDGSNRDISNNVLTAAGTSISFVSEVNCNCNPCNYAERIKVNRKRPHAK